MDVLAAKIMNFPFKKHFKEQFNSSLSFVNKPILLSITNLQDTQHFDVFCKYFTQVVQAYWTLISVVLPAAQWLIKKSHSLFIPSAKYQEKYLKISGNMTSNAFKRNLIFVIKNVIVSELLCILDVKENWGWYRHALFARWTFKTYTHCL